MRVAKGLMTAFVLAYLGCVGAVISAQHEHKENPAAKAMKNPVPATPESIAEGEKLYQKYCKFCHGETGKGDGTMAPKNSHPSDFTDDKWDHGSSDGEIFVVIRDGAGPKSPMKPFKSKMSEKEIWSVVNYIKTFGPNAKSR